MRWPGRSGSCSPRKGSPDPLGCPVSATLNHVDQRRILLLRPPRRSPLHRQTARTATLDDHLREVAQVATTFVLIDGFGLVGSVGAGRQCRTAQPATNSRVVRTDRGAIQVLRRHCPEPARRFESYGVAVKPSTCTGRTLEFHKPPAAPATDRGRGCFWTIVLTLTTWVMAIGLAVFLFG
jgi:hypothetical protein